MILEITTIKLNFETKKSFIKCTIVFGKVPDILFLYNSLELLKFISFIVHITNSKRLIQIPKHMQILISDELLSGKITNQFEIELDSNMITVKDLISKRVSIEIQQYYQRLPEYFQGLVMPDEAEQTLNGFKIKKTKIIDIEQQTYVALDAFQKNRFFVLVDNQQLDSLDDLVSLHSTSKISFVKLTPLVGG